MRTSYESVADLRRIKSKSDQVKTFHTSSFQFNVKIIFPFHYVYILFRTL